MAIYFVRHGETECNVKGVYYGSLNVPITENGRRQAESVGEMLKAVPFQRVITSRLKRTQQTAEWVLSKQSPENPRLLEWQKKEAFNEMDFGAWEGLHYTKVRELYPEDYRKMMEDWIHCPPTGGEIFLEFNDRVLKAWERLHIDGKENVLFVGHGGPIQCILCHLLGMKPSDIWHLEIRQGAYTKVEMYKDFSVLKGMNLERREIFG